MNSQPTEQNSKFSGIYIYCVLSHFSHVQLFVTLWTTVLQAPLSMGFSRQEYLWVAMPSSRGSSWPRDWTHISYVFFTGRGAVPSVPLVPPGKPICLWSITYSTILLLAFKLFTFVTMNNLIMDIFTYRCIFLYLWLFPLNRFLKELLDQKIQTFLRSQSNLSKR